MNRLTEQYEARISSTSKLFNPIADHMRQQAYSDWQTVVNEHIVRAITVRMAFLHFGEDTGMDALERERDRGFRYIEPILDELIRYERNRVDYSSLSEFYPQLISVFEVLATE